MTTTASCRWHPGPWSLDWTGPGQAGRAWRPPVPEPETVARAEERFKSTQVSSCAATPEPQRCRQLRFPLGVSAHASGREMGASCCSDGSRCPLHPQLPSRKRRHHTPSHRRSLALPHQDGGSSIWPYISTYMMPGGN